MSTTSRVSFRMRSIGLAASLWLLGTVVNAQTATAESAIAEPGVDNTIQPGDDFFAYANGGWLKATEIPAGKGRWTVRDEIAALADQQIKNVFEDAVSHPETVLARKVADFHAAYMNEAAIDKQGIAAIKPILQRIDGIHDRMSLSQVLGTEMLADVDPLGVGVYSSSHLLGLSVEQGMNGEPNNVAFLLQGGLGLPGRDYYLSDDARMQGLRIQYRDYISRMLGLAGYVHSPQQAEAVLALETAIAKSHFTEDESGDEGNANNLWSHADFVNKAPGMNWAAFFTAAGLSQQKALVVWQPSAIIGAAKLVNSESLQVWKDYLRVRVVDRYADVLPHDFSAAAFALHGAAVNGMTQPIPRAQRALDATQKALGDALGQLYVQKYFPPAYKARVQTIASNVIAALCRSVPAMAWMAPDTRAQAMVKLQNVYFGVGYPEAWRDYSTLHIDAKDAAGNRRRVAEWNYRNALAHMDKPVDLSQWWLTPQTAGAVLLFQQNAYNFPAGLLQVTKFDPKASDATNYGAIGAIIGHEASHLIDILGADYDSLHRKHRWWAASDMEHYATVTEPLVKQFISYQPFADSAVNGKLGLTENFADLRGLNAAFDAYRLTLGDQINNANYLRQQDRQFFIGFARAWRSKYRDDALRKQAASDHAPETYRVATVRNIDAWYDAFNVTPGQRLYLEPSERIHTAHTGDSTRQH